MSWGLGFGGFFFLGKFFHLGELGAAGMDGREYGYINTVSEISNSAQFAGTCDEGMRRIGYAFTGLVRIGKVWLTGAT